MEDNRLRLGERDKAVLAALDRWGVLGLGQLEGLVFRRESEVEEKVGLLFDEYGRDAFDRYGYKRMRRLERSGLVKTGIGPRGLVYWLARAGKTVLDGDGVKDWVPMRRKWPREARMECAWATAVGLVCAEVLGSQVRTHHQLESLARVGGVKEAERWALVPHLAAGPRQWPLFVEPGGAAHREGVRWQRLRQERILYVTGDAQCRLVLAQAERQSASWVYAVGISEFRHELGGALLANFKGMTVTLAEVLGVERSGAERPDSGGRGQLGMASADSSAAAEASAEDTVHGKRMSPLPNLARLFGWKGAKSS